MTYFSHIRWYFNFFFSTFDSSIVTCDISTNITCDCTFVTFNDSFFFSLTFENSNITLGSMYQHHKKLYFCHIWWFPYFFLTFDSSIVTLGSTNITFDHTFLTFSSALIFFLTFDSFIIILRSTNIRCDRFLSHLIVFFFFSHLMVPMSY